VPGGHSDPLQGAHGRLSSPVLKPGNIALVSVQALCELILG
jgi:hypothetical protein